MGRKFLLEDGTTADVPDESIDAWMQRMDQRGVQFKDAGFDKPASPVSKEIVMPVQNIEGDPEEGMSPLAKLGKRLKDTLRAAPSPGSMAATKTADALGGGFEHGVSAGLERRLPGGAGELMRELDDNSRNASPALYAGADVAGALASPIKGPGSAAGPAGRIAQTAGTMALQSAARTVGDTNPDEDTTTQAIRALASGAKGLGYGAALGAGSELVGLAAGPLDRASIALRRSAFSPTSGDNQKLIAEMGTRKGLTFIEEELGRLPEKQGLTNVIVPQSASSLAKRAADKNKLVNGPELGDSLSEAGYQLTPQPQPRDSAWRPPLKAPAVNRGQIEAQLAEKAKIAKTSPALTGQDASNFVEAQGRLRNQTITTPTDLQDLKNAYEDRAFAPGSVAGSMESSAANVNEAAATATREHLNDVMSQADPATYAKFKRANENFGDTAMVENMARAHAARGLAAPLLSAGLGGVAGYEVRHNGGDALAGAALGGSLGRTYGADLAANVTRLGQQGASAITSAEPALAKLGGYLASDEGKVSAQDASGETRGHLIPQAIQDALRENRLGPYSDTFARAAMAEEPGALGVAFSRLSQDPQFAPYKRMLQEMTGGMQ